MDSRYRKRGFFDAINDIGECVRTKTALSKKQKNTVLLLRQIRRDGMLTTDEVRLIDAQIPNFNWEVVDFSNSSFETLVEAVTAFVERKGRLPARFSHLNVATDAVEIQLSKFLSHTASRKSTLSVDQISLVERIPGFRWSKRSRVSPSFEETLESVKSFVHRYKVFPRKDGPLENETNMADFLYNRRQDYKKGKLSVERVAAMNTIAGFKWTECKHKTFEESVAWAIKFSAEFGPVDPPKARGKRWEGEEKRLHSFLSHQRRLKKNSQLSPEHIALLESIPGFLWEVSDGGDSDCRSFEDSVDAVRRFVTEFKELPRQKLIGRSIDSILTTTQGIRNDGDERRLGRFIDTNRQRRKDGRLNATRAALLETIPGFKWIGRNDAVP